MHYRRFACGLAMLMTWSALGSTIWHPVRAAKASDSFPFGSELMLEFGADARLEAGAHDRDRGERRGLDRSLVRKRNRTGNRK